ncbi:MAG: hypothetical protein MI974_14595 [Chitinophagales bacterium]|nr:hypothetical protein [Chitinophagales bacterium]
MDSQNSVSMLDRTIGTSAQIIYDDVYSIITLGNPKQQCRYFGICRLESWTPDVSPVDMKSNQCIAQMLSLSLDEQYLEIVFLEQFLTNQQKAYYFDSYFLVEEAYILSNCSMKLLGIKHLEGGSICNGKYYCTIIEKGIKVKFQMQLVGT